MLHLKAPHLLLGELKARYSFGRRSWFAHPDAVARYVAWRDAGNWPEELRPLVDHGLPR